MKKKWDEIGVFPLTEQGLADQARQIRTINWLTDIEIEDRRRKLDREKVKWKFRRMVKK